MAELMYDEFKIKNKININNDDINALTHLYLPLMGLDSYALYFAYVTLDKNETYTFKSLLDILNLRTMTSLNKASSKLEALGLLRVFKDKNDNYLFEIKRPMSMDVFLKDEALCALLASSISNIEVDKLKEKYLNKNTRLKEVTKSFEEVFDVKTSDDLSFIKTLVSNDINIENKEFNYALFKMLFDSSFIGDDVLEDETFKKNIIHISFVYKLDEEMMHDACMSSLNVDKDLSYASLAKFAKIQYRNKFKNDNPSLQTIESDDYLNSIKDDEVLALCNHLEAMSPSEVLEYYNGGKKASEAEIAMFDKLSNDTHTPIPVINLMIVYSVVTKNGEIPGYAYFEKIASTWKRAKVKNVYDAINYMKKKAQEKEEKDNTKVSRKKNVKLPAWYDSYKKELEKKESENENLKEGKAVDILEAAKGLFGDDDE